MRRARFLKFVVSACVLVAIASPAWAQWNTPTIDGTINTGEYGTNNSLQNAGNTGQTWYMTWDATNLYIGIVKANLSEGAVIYITDNPQTNNGSTVGIQLRRHRFRVTSLQGASS